MSSKLLGGVLLVVGTTIGAGILALPVATAALGFWGSLGLLLGCWTVMTACAFLFLEVNLWLPANTNLISMAGATLGKSGQAVSWVVYLALLYSILSAYIAGGGDLFHYVLNTKLGVQISQPISSVFFTFLFGAVVYLGIKSVDYVNRGLMFGKMGALLLLIFILLPFVTGTNLANGEIKNIMHFNSLLTTTVAFGCIMIIPSLRTYFGDDVKTLRKAIWIGTLIPLVCYIAWDMVIMGIIPLEGTPGLKEMMVSSSSNSDMVSALTVLLQKNTVTVLANFFMPICMVTSFLSVSLSLSDFLSDGFGIKKKGIMGNGLVFGATFLPPLLVVLFYPDAFLRGIQYAGVCCIVLMILLPPLMAWRGRYHCALVQGEDSYQVVGGKLLLAFLLMFATLMMIGFGIKGA